jgi:hypothetical protein
MPAPNRGEVWLVDLGLAGKVRPCLALSGPAGPLDRSLATLVLKQAFPASQFGSLARGVVDRASPLPPCE